MTPERRKVKSEQQKKLIRDPAWRARCGFLQEWEYQMIVDVLREGKKNMEEIADDWLITAARVSQIGKQAGLPPRGTGRPRKS